jgi:manganese/zinc/iron transport system permease protein
MGVVFTSLFALGLIMIVQAADHVDLDPGCVLYGAIEMTHLDKVTIAGIGIPRVVVTLGVVLLMNVAFVWWFYKELVLTSFDPGLADTSGFRSVWLHYGLMTLVAITAVACFESVGNILVVAMFVVPAATASLCTDRLPRMILISSVFAAMSAILGHCGAITIPGWFGYASTTTAGMMAAMSGFLFLLTLVFAPKEGLLAKTVRHQRLAWSIFGDDLLAYLYRKEERGLNTSTARKEIQESLLSGAWSTWWIVFWYEIRGRIVETGGSIELTKEGRQRALKLVRSHRLWEQYLVEQAGLPSDRIHGQAERLEHYTDHSVRAELERETEYPNIDPHGSPIPTEGTDRT